MLKLNCDKTEVMFFAPKNTPDPPGINIRVGATPVIPSSSVRNLGVIMDKTMTMDKQVTSIMRSCYSQLRNIGQIRRYLTPDATRSLVHGLVTSRLDYCNPLLYGISASLTSKLQRIQNTAARIITRTRRDQHITPVLADLHWLPVKRRIEYKILVHTYKALHGEGPSYLKNLVQRYIPRRSLRSQDSLTLVPPTRRTVTYGDRSFSSSAPLLWNRLPNQLRDRTKLSSFKSDLKTHFFKQEYL